MEKLNDNVSRSGGLSRGKVRLWGLIFLAAGILGRSVLQNRFLGMGESSSQQLLELMESSDDVMIIATIALILQAVETCAVPIFSYLLVEGMQHTSDFSRYAMRILGVAVLSEIPYNLAMGGDMVDLSSRSPAFGLVLCMVVLYFYQRYAEGGMQNTVIKIVVVIAAMLWSVMLKVEYGVALVLLTCVLWIFRKNSLYQGFAGATAAVVCSLTSPFFMASPMSFLIIHFHNGEKGKESRMVNYLAYPAMLLVIGLLAKTL